MTDVVAEYRDAVHMKVRTSPDIMQEMSSYFTFRVPGYRHMPAYRSGFWDGCVRLLSPLVGLIYAGLRRRVRQFAEDRGYTYEEVGFPENRFSYDDAMEFIDSLELPEHIEVRDYQVETLVRAIHDERMLALCPTNGGKSLIIYLLAAYRLAHGEGRPVLVVVPRAQLVEQLRDNFIEYGFDPDRVHGIVGGVEKDSARDVTISTWQSIYKLPPEWFERFGTLVGDEAHNFQAKSLTLLLSKLPGCPFRFGCTGTLDDTRVHEMVLEGLFGTVYASTTQAELMERGISAELDIRVTMLRHPPESRALIGSLAYADEIEYLEKCPARNRFIRDLAVSRKGNTLLLFRHVAHGKLLRDLLDRDAVGNRPVHLIYGGVDREDRAEICRLLEEQEDAVVVASFGTFSEGINAPSLRHTIFASPYKSRIKNLQSIGRGLRVLEDKDRSTLYDVADDFGYAVPNHTLRHAHTRMRIYRSEQFHFKVYELNLRY
jgi:superfamily II DNA or RNA helicase